MKMNKSPVLYIFSGLSGSGKTTLAQELAQQTNSVHLRIDTIEQALRDLCSIDVQAEGYKLSYRIAADNLSLGMSVVADSCNPIVLTRNEWEQVATRAKANFVNIEVVCSDRAEHRRRIETRHSRIKGLVLPTWNEVESREYHVWETDRVVIETSNKTIDESVNALLSGAMSLHVSA